MMLSSVLLTGATGFLGKVVLEELLRRREELGLERVYLLIRRRGGHDAADRFRREIAASPCFSLLPGDWTDRVTVVEGTLAKQGLALAPDARAALRDRVTHVLHTAASVDFDLPLRDATHANVTTCLHLLDEIRPWPRLDRLVSVSTAYVAPFPGRGVAVEEATAPLPGAAEELYHSILHEEVHAADLLRRSGHPNTYTFTKALAEHLLLERRDGIPITIVRPSIISASWRHPFPGWIDSTAAFSAFVILVGLGHLRAIVGDLDTRVDLIPVDEAATGILQAAVAPAGLLPVIRHVVAGLERSPRIRDCWDGIRDFFRVHQVARRPTLAYFGPRGWRFTLADLLHHRVGIALAELRPGGRRRSGRRLRSRIDQINRVFPYFTTNSFHFQAPVPLPGDFDPQRYVGVVCRGVHRHILRRDETQWPLAGRTHPGHGGDLRWAWSQPHGNAWIRTASWVVTKVLRRCVDRVTVDIPSFEAARRALPEGTPVVIVPNHRSYLDFVLCSYLCFARPDLGIPIPHIAATLEFGKIPILGRILSAMHAFYLRRGLGRPDPDLTRRVHELIAQGRTLEFFIEGQRSRSREFLPPKRGLLRCLQATRRTVGILPVALSYDRVPEERVFARELAGAPKPKMRLRSLLGWSVKAWRRQIDLGRVHIACGPPLLLGSESEVHAVSEEIIRRLRDATVATTFHLEAYLLRHPLPGVDPAWLRSAIEESGGRVLPSHLRPSDDLDPRIAASFRHQFAHRFENNGSADERMRLLYQQLFGSVVPLREREPAG